MNSTRHKKPDVKGTCKICGGKYIRDSTYLTGFCSLYCFEISLERKYSKPKNKSSHKTIEQLKDKLRRHSQCQTDL